MRLLPLLAAFACLAAALPALGDPTIRERLGAGPPIVIAQRALGGAHPENSLAGLRFALDKGIEMVRIDIQETRDGTYVVMHDPTLNRTTNVEAVYPAGPPSGPDREARGGKDYIRDYTAEEIAALNLTDGRDGALHGVPAFDDALALAAEGLFVLVGLKVYSTETLAAHLSAHDPGGLMLFDLYYGSASAMEAAAHSTGLPAAMALVDSRDPVGDLDRLEAALGSSLAMVVARPRHATPEFMARARALGVAVCISGVHTGEDAALVDGSDPDRWRELLERKADAYLTTRPLEVLSLMRHSN